MFSTPIMGFARPRRAIILTTRRIIIRTIHGTVTTAARTTTASKPRVSPLLVAVSQSDRSVTFAMKREASKRFLLLTYTWKRLTRRFFALLVFLGIAMPTGHSLDTYPSWLPSG